MKNNKRIITTIIILASMLFIIVAKQYKINALEQELNTINSNTVNTKVNDKITVAYTLTESNNVYIEEGETYTELTNGTWYICNDKTNTYIFQATELGDWDITVNSREDLNKIIDTYLEYHNNINQE